MKNKLVFPVLVSVLVLGVLLIPQYVYTCDFVDPGKCVGDIVLQFKLILIVIAVMLIALVGIKIYEIIDIHNEKDRFYKLEENVAELVKLASRIVTDSKNPLS